MNVHKGYPSWGERLTHPTNENPLITRLAGNVKTIAHAAGTPEHHLIERVADYITTGDDGFGGFIAKRNP